MTGRERGSDLPALVEQDGRGSITPGTYMQTIHTYCFIHQGLTSSDSVPRGLPSELGSSHPIDGWVCTHISNPNPLLGELLRKRSSGVVYLLNWPVTLWVLIIVFPRDLIQLPDYCRANLKLSIIPRALSKCQWNTTRHGTLITSFSSLFQC